MAIELVGDQCDLYDRLSELTQTHPPGTVFNLTGERACYRTSNGDVFWMRGVRCGCGTLAEAVRALTVQMLGPIELDANGEASGEGWRVERHTSDGVEKCTLYFGEHFICCRSLESLAEHITLQASDEKMSAERRAALRRWCEDVGWFRGEQPDTLTCGPLRLERFEAGWVYGVAAFLQVFPSAQDGTFAYAAGKLLGRAASPAEAAQALAAAIEASADPAVVRFREEHWHVACRRDRSAHQPAPQQIAARLDALELAKSTRHPFPPELLAEWRNGTGRPNARALQELRDYAAELRDAAGELVEVCDAVDR